MALTGYVGRNINVMGEQAEIEYLRNNSHSRSSWIDAHINSFTNGANCSFPKIDSLRITEIMYDPASQDPEFIELKNIGTSTVQLLTHRFSNGIYFIFSTSVSVNPGTQAFKIDIVGQFLVLVSNATAFTAKYPGIQYSGEFSGSLSNSGDKITLEDAYGYNILSVKFNNVLPWPQSNVTDGFSIVPINVNPPLIEQEDGSKWRFSSVLGGSPGRDGTVYLFGK